MVFVIGILADQSHAESAHEAGDSRTDDVAAQKLFKGAQYGVIIERAALDHDMFAQFGRIFYFDDLVQGIFDDRVGKAGGDIGEGCPFFLGLFDLGIHEDGAAGTQVNRAFGKECRFGKFFDG